MLQFQYEALRPGGVLLIYDVIAPPDGERQVLVRLNREDGRNEDYDREFPESDAAGLEEYLTGLSTYGKFRRFALDYNRLNCGFRVQFQEAPSDEGTLVRMSVRCLREFIGKKDYLDNWLAEMKETFTYWDFERWRSELETIGFRISPASREFINEHVVRKFLRGKVDVFDEAAGAPVSRNFPVTNMILVAEKPGSS